MQATVHSNGTHRLEQLGVTFADTGVLLNFESAYHEAMALNSSLGVRVRTCGRCTSWLVELGLDTPLRWQLAHVKDTEAGSISASVKGFGVVLELTFMAPINYLFLPI